MNLVDGINKLKEAGLGFRDCIAAFSEDDDNPYVKAAREIHHVEGEVEVDEFTVVSKDDDAEGAYVMAWVWVSSEALAPAEAEVIYLTSDQPFACTSCGSRTNQEGPADESGRWTEVCVSCGKRHLVENGDASSDTPMFRNFYTCPCCGNEWQDEWSATCDDDCPKCGKRHISPVHSEDL